MGRIAERFSALASQGQKALVPFVLAGDPTLEDLPEILDALAEAGADVIEVGIPFSDPIADGPTIQAASQRALDRGVTPSDVLAAVSRRDPSGPPIVLMGYLNPILRMGLQAFADRAAAVGCSGTIVSDLTPEESQEWRSASERAGLDTIFLAAPTSTDARLEVVCRASTGFVYAVSRTGVTGAAQEVPPEVSHLVERIKARTGRAVCVGFGISRPEHVAMVCRVADGAVVGSWLVDRLARDWNAGEGRARLIEAVRALKAATRA